MLLVTGAHGFVGRNVVRQLHCQPLTPSRESLDLLNQAEVFAYFKSRRPSRVIHCAGSVGGIEANRKNPGKFFYDNLQMGLNILEASRLYGVSKIVFVSTVCAYPKFAPIPFNELDLWNGYPEETNAPYGIAKRALTEGMKFYQQQYGIKAVSVVPTNIYGPGEKAGEASHVIGAMVHKFLEAVKNGTEVTLWGDGTPTRDFLYVEDAARGIIEALKWEGTFNLSSNREVSISELAKIVAKETGYQGVITWDTSKPNGQPRRKVDPSKAILCGWTPATSLEMGIANTVAWSRPY